MCRLLFSFLIIISCRTWAAESSGEQLAHAPTVIVAEFWHYTTSVPVYQVDIHNSDSHSAKQAVEAAIASVRPEFAALTPALIASLSNYIVAEQHTGTHSRYYIRRSIVADWLITS